MLGRDGVERLRAVAALEEERLTPGDRSQALAQLVALAGEDERRIGLQLGDHIAQSLLVRPFGLLRRGQVSPGVATGVDFSVHGHGSNFTGSGQGSISPTGM
ncbi:hypothetical protein SRIMM317S_06496 [Streptomyces rimosus subsp. rimosus]